MKWFTFLAVVLVAVVAAHLARTPSPARRASTSSAARFDSHFWRDPSSVCPAGARMRGSTPPDGTEIWCEKPDGTRHGQHIEWSADGKRVRERTYDNGLLDGPNREWGRSGSPLRAGRYHAGVRAGRWVEWKDRGVAVVTEYRDGAAYSSRTVTTDIAGELAATGP
jgi:hypothetical protein